MLVEADGFLGLGEGLFAATEVAQPVGQVVEGHGQIGQEGVGAGGGELLVEADGFLGLGEGLFAASEVAEPDA